MNYPPKHHQEANVENVIRTIEAFPLATVISSKDSEVFVTHIPLVYETTANGLGKLVGHLDKFNPHVNLLKDNKHCTIIFNGPQTYISPSVYSTRQLPTWNYIKVHITGKVRSIEDANGVKDTLIRMTEVLETPKQAYKLDKDDSRMESLIDYIVGFEIMIESWEGKFKISQDKNKKDRQITKQELLNSEAEKNHDFINSIYEHHENLN